ncbi:MAG: hypothetical protein WDZ72_04520, partial [Cyclobacteriaceae bacterium]
CIRGDYFFATNARMVLLKAIRILTLFYPEIPPNFRKHRHSLQTATATPFYTPQPTKKDSR